MIIIYDNMVHVIEHIKMAMNVKQKDGTQRIS